MAEPVTNLTYEWVDKVGVTFSWTASSDVTNKSEYEIYYLDVSQMTPIWQLLSTLQPIPVKSSSSVTHVLTPPSTTFFFDWKIITGLVRAGKIAGFANDPSAAPVNIAFGIQQVAGDGTESDWFSTFAFPPAINQSSSPVHFTNNFQFDAFGQVSNNLQNSLEEIQDSVAMLMGTTIGQRPLTPTYGVYDMPLNVINTETLAASVKLWEPRAIVQFDVVYDQQGNPSLNVNLKTNTGV